MKRKNVITSLVIMVSLLLITTVSFAWMGGYGMGHFANANVDSVKKFQKETLSLRDDLVTKNLELQNELSKDDLDTNRIAALRKDITDLQSKVQEVAKKYELPAEGPMGGSMMGRGMMGQGMGGGMMGSGRMMGAGYNCPGMGY